MVGPVDDLMEMGGERMNDGEWWYEYLTRSPGCVRAMSVSGRIRWRFICVIN